MSRFIQVKVDVEDASKAQTFSSQTAAGPIGAQNGNLYFVGVAGCGRKTLAQRAAKRLGLTPAEAASTDALRALAAGQGQAVAVTGADLTDPDVQQLLRATGKVFYLMSAAPILVKRLGDRSRLEELALACQQLEPIFMGMAHFILPIDATPEEMEDNVAEKALL